MLTRLIQYFLNAVTASLLATSIAAHAANNDIIIGQSIDLSGPNASIGRDYVAGIKTYFDMVNAAGGINGRRIQYIVLDDQGQPQLSAKAASELLDRYQIDYLLGGVGDDATRAVLDSPAFRRSGHILFAPLAAADYASSGRVLFWRPGYKQEVRHIFSHFSKLGLNDVGVVYQDTPLNQDAYRALSAAVQERGMKLVGSARIGVNGEQLAQEARRLAEAKPGFILVIADTIGTAQFLKEYRQHDGQTFVAGTSLTNLSTLRELAGSKAVEWTVFSQVVPNPSAGTTLIQVEHLSMMKKFRDEAVSSLTLEGFAAAKALTKAIQQSKRNGRSALQELISQNGTIDLGGLSAATSGESNRLSNYLDIALFKKGSGLVF
ncbi:MAG TPA: ABC transporter substrate-binding protein [Noviherbaspirillum sp.]|nr:ABC transporter substrate-binding protein [Noviherbaspirillum sp.]